MGQEGEKAGESLRKRWDNPSDAITGAEQQSRKCLGVEASTCPTNYVLDNYDELFDILRRADRFEHSYYVRKYNCDKYNLYSILYAVIPNGNDETLIEQLAFLRLFSDE